MPTDEDRDAGHDDFDNACPKNQSDSAEVFNSHASVNNDCSSNTFLLMHGHGKKSLSKVLLEAMTLEQLCPSVQEKGGCCQGILQQIPGRWV
jgi:hypothetical protein